MIYVTNVTRELQEGLGQRQAPSMVFVRYVRTVLIICGAQRDPGL